MHLNLTVGDIRDALENFDDEIEISIETNENSIEVFDHSVFYKIQDDQQIEQFIKIDKSNLLETIENFKVIDIKKVLTLNLYALFKEKQKDLEEKEKRYKQELEKIEQKEIILIPNEESYEDNFEEDDEESSEEEKWMNDFEKDVESDDDVDDNIDDESY